MKASLVQCCLHHHHSPACPSNHHGRTNSQEDPSALIQDLLTRVHFGETDEGMLGSNPNIVFQYDQAYVERKIIAP